MYLYITYFIIYDVCVCVLVCVWVCVCMRVCVCTYRAPNKHNYTLSLFFVLTSSKNELSE